jgi:glycosyltransferase involved in cell wall biosynthesis
MKKKICITFEHFVSSNGVSRAAIVIANLLNHRGYDVTLVPLFKVENKLSETLNTGVHLRKIFGFYFRGFAKFIDIIPDNWLYKLIFARHNYDLEIGFQKDMPIKIIAASTHHSCATRIAWMHGYDEGLLLKKQYEIVGRVICVSRKNSERLLRELPSIKADYCYNPTDDKIVVERGKEKIPIERPNEGLLFVSVGRHSPEKGYMRLLNIVKRLKEEGYNFTLWLVGDGPEHDKLISHSRELKVEKIVNFIGATPNPHKFTSKADVFICSSYREGYSTACTESIMLGIPVVTTDVGGSREIIEDSECGIHCALDDESLYNALKEILENPELVSEWKETLLQTKIRFSQEVRAQRLYKIIDEIMAVQH